MDNADYRRILEEEGFEIIGSVAYQWPMSVCWNLRLRIELATVEIGTYVILRASKAYNLKAMGREGELFARDLAGLQEFLTSHFEELHVRFSSFRDVSRDLISRRIREKNFRRVGQEADPSAETTLEQTSSEIQDLQEELDRDESLLRLNRDRSSLAQRYLPGKIAQTRRRLQELIGQRKRLTDMRAVQEQLASEYERKAEAVSLCFINTSNVQIAGSPVELPDAVRSVVKEIQDVHKYQIRQKLEGGKLKIYTEELAHPGVALLSRWTGAVLNPRQLARLGPQFTGLFQAVEEALMVLPRQNILLGGSVQDEKKLVGARIVRNFLKKLEIVPTAPAAPPKSPAGTLPVWVGNTYRGDAMTSAPWELPFDEAGHLFFSGSTGSGKSVAGRTTLEGCLGYAEVSVLVLDPGNQWVSILVPEDRPKILRHYSRFGLKETDARGFAVDYYAPGLGAGRPMPSDPRVFASGRSVLTFRGMKEQDRYNLAAEILNAVFDTCSRSEADRRRTIIVIEEVANFVKKRASGRAREAAAHCERQIDRVTREGRKYGLHLLLIGQSIRDFSHDVAIIRQNITTRFFLRNSDRELEYAADFLDDGRLLTQLQPGQAFVCNPAWGAVKIAIRPPLSKVWQPDDASVRELVGSAEPPRPTLSAEAQAVLDLVTQRHCGTGRPVRLAEVAEQLAITSRRKLNAIVHELEGAQVATFTRLKQRGQPLVVVPTRAEGAHKPFENADKDGR